MEDKRAMKHRAQRRYFVKFMSFFHGRDYPHDHTFERDEIVAVTPADIIKFLDQRKHLHKTVTGLEGYRFAISNFVPDKETKWDPVAKRGNPAKSKELRDYFSKLRQDEKNQPKEPPPPHLLHPQPPPPMGSELMYQQQIEKMQRQNNEFIQMCDTFSQSLKEIKSIINVNNALLSELKDMKPDFSKPVRDEGRNQNNKNRPLIVEKIQRREWWHVHDDGKERRVPPSWTFPMCNLRTLYSLWHLGDGIACPMKYYTNEDVGFIGRKATAYLNRTKSLMKAIDDEAEIQGLKPRAIKTPPEVAACFDVGWKRIRIPLVAPCGKLRNIDKLGWDTVHTIRRKELKIIKKHEVMVKKYLNLPKKQKVAVGDRKEES